MTQSMAGTIRSTEFYTSLAARFQNDDQPEERQREIKKQTSPGDDVLIKTKAIRGMIIHLLEWDDCD